jgi:hypothetical protein
MKLFLRLLFVPLLLTSLTFAQMQLKLSNDFEQQTIPTTLESKNQLILPNTSIAPPDAMDFYKGMIMLGLMADVTVPFGDKDTGFRHIAGTGFSIHAMAGYLINQSFLLTLRAGYVKFGTQTTEGSDLGFDYKYEDKYSQIPIFLGAYFLFATKGNFKPYLGLALGAVIQTYNANWVETGLGYDYSFDGSSSTTSFGIAPGLGAYLLLSGVMLNFLAEYNYVFTQPKSVEEDYTYDYTLGKVSDISKIAQDETDNSNEKPSSFSFSVGVSFPLGK